MHKIRERCHIINTASIDFPRTNHLPTANKLVSHYGYGLSNLLDKLHQWKSDLQALPVVSTKTWSTLLRANLPWTSHERNRSYSSKGHALKPPAEVEGSPFWGHRQPLTIIYDPQMLPLPPNPHSTSRSFYRVCLNAALTGWLQKSGVPQALS